MFVTAEDASEPAVVKELVEEDHMGIILPDGQINWDCPCLGGMAHGSCGSEFKDAFSCFHYRYSFVACLFVFVVVVCLGSTTNLTTNSQKSASNWASN